jgi:hypothetical protein
VDLSAVRPLVWNTYESRSEWIFSYILPLLSVLFGGSHSDVPDTWLPDRYAKFARDSALPPSDPISQSIFARTAWPREEMHMVGHNYILTDSPPAGVTPYSMKDCGDFRRTEIVPPHQRRRCHKDNTTVPIKALKMRRWLSTAWESDVGIAGVHTHIFGEDPLMLRYNGPNPNHYREGGSPHPPCYASRSLSRFATLCAAGRDSRPPPLNTAPNQRVTALKFLVIVPDVFAENIAARNLMPRFAAVTV